MSLLNIDISKTPPSSFSTMDLLALTFILLACSLSSGAVLVLSPKRRHVLLGRLSLRRASESGESAHLLPAEKTKPKPPDAVSDYKDTFPPARRGALRNIYDHLPASLTDGRSPDELVNAYGEGIFGEKRDPSPASYVPLDKPLSELNGDLLTATGFSVDEIRALGDFPDYATLSDVPKPAAYEGFDIAKALPRPYRPFRWAYHQTMCESWSSLAFFTYGESVMRD